MSPSLSIRNARLFWLPVLVLLLVLPALVSQKPYFSGTDISAWINDWDRFNECISIDIKSCGRISQFPLAYLLNSWAIGNLEGAHTNIPLITSAVNIFFLLMPLLFIFTVSQKNIILSATIIYITSILLTSLPAFYVHSGALEVQSGIMIGIFISSWILLNSKSQERNEGRILLFLVPSGISSIYYKDTNILIIIGALLLCQAQQVFTPKAYLKNNFLSRPKRSHLIILSSVFLLGILSTIGYNYLRYHTFSPNAYLAVAKFTSPSSTKSFEFFLATFFSPNGGFLIFWCASLVGCLYLMREFSLRIRPAAITTSLALIVSSALGFSLWWAPFGWDAWGDRLIIPAALASLIIIITTAIPVTTEKQQPSSDQTARQHHTRSIFLMALLSALTIASIYYTASAYYSNRGKLIHSSLFGGKNCQEMMHIMRDNSIKLGLDLWRSEHYYKCARERFTHTPQFIRNDQ